MPVYGSVLYLFTIKFVTASFVFSVSTPHPLVLVPPRPRHPSSFSSPGCFFSLRPFEKATQFKIVDQYENQLLCSVFL